MSTHTDEDLTILESLDFEPACEKSNHDSGESASWVAIFAPRHPCGCVTPGLMLWCDPCQKRHVSTGRIGCIHCGACWWHPESSILRFEPLR